MKVISIIRSQEWWAPKLSPLLAIGYATALICDVPLYQVILWLIFLLCALIFGAIYVSVINDLTDLEEDIASGKSNRIQQVPARFRWLIPASCLLLGLGFGYFLYPDLLSCVLYLMSWIVFTLYSVKPVRLKNRGILGVFADSCGSHLFTSLLMVTSVSYKAHHPVNWIWFGAIGVWAFCYGLRGILWHQFSDRDNDIKVNLNTYASRVTPEEFKPKVLIIFALEIIALIVILHEINLIITLIALILYFILVYIRYSRYKRLPILVMKPGEELFQIFMADYYQIFFPLSLLLFAVGQNTLNLIPLITYILLFPFGLWSALRDYTAYTVAIFVRRYRIKPHNDKE